jgi:hypothetical protein
VPSTAEYIAIGETTTRFSSAMSRSRNGANIGGAGSLTGDPRAFDWNQRSTPSSQALSRSRRFSWLTRCERVSSE